MKIEPIKTRIFREHEDLNLFVLQHIKKIPEKSILAVTSKIVSLSEGRTEKHKGEREKAKLIKKESDLILDKNNLFTIKKLYVSKGFLGLIRYDSKIIPYRNIIEILADKIIVKEDLMAIKVKNERDEMVIEDMPVG